jgi:hypothetical protein
MTLLLIEHLIFGLKFALFHLHVIRDGYLSVP